MGRNASSVFSALFSRGIGLIRTGQLVPAAVYSQWSVPPIAPRLSRAGYCHVHLPSAFLKRGLVATPGLPCAVFIRVAAPESRPPGRRSPRQIRKWRGTRLGAPKATTPRKSLRARKVRSEWIRVTVREATPGICLDKPFMYLPSALGFHYTQLLPGRAGEDRAVLGSKRRREEKGQGRTRASLSVRKEQTAATHTGSVVGRSVGTRSFLECSCGCEVPEHCPAWLMVAGSMSVTMPASGSTIGFSTAELFLKPGHQGICCKRW